MIQAFLRSVRSRMEKATESDWAWAKFSAYSRQDIMRLLRLVERYRAELEKIATPKTVEHPVLPKCSCSGCSAKEALEFLGGEGE